MCSFLNKVTYTRIAILLGAAIVLGILIASVSDGPIRLLAIIGISLIAFVLQGAVNIGTGSDEPEDR
ncbi:hypothetical protein [Paenibacillus apiarius]|uniref:DUF2892 domain-containing protein n=2 Tax=Paenibacillus apiarius TaxID=46240 RepID=A0ABT4DQE8_9BACL|nr:hypothetical protein [Paenibacillus apiarius]MCY9516324.1 hypothetical protein [Paenibacillus apiarius]MCY9519578.1 hypothetical protein [Paenibacillus apiarius]MCY9554660.1 hypothetical protein [Paenibacillus apiarius]MCY9561513.1 hypothetical protein [Paenibacillus apiarius]MCY9684256.1 hypothetical protein [Paenibacillus apiarius]